MVEPSLPLKRSSNIKFLCSYGGKILPRHPDGKLRYHAGETRVLAVDRYISFSELMVKLGELCGEARVSLRCQLPKEDLDALVSVTSDEDLSNLIEEYERCSAPKIRAFLSLPKKPSSFSSSTTTSSSSSNSISPSNSSNTLAATIASTSTTPRCYHHPPKPTSYTTLKKVVTANAYAYRATGNHSRTYLLHHGNHLQKHGF